MNWFCELRRWIRVYLCFLLPTLGAGILFYFRQWIAAAVFLCIMVFLLLPLFIYSEEKFSEQRHDEITELLRKSLQTRSAQTPKGSSTPSVSGISEKKYIKQSNSTLNLTGQGNNETAASDRAAILIVQKDTNRIIARISEIATQSTTCDEETKRLLFIERDILLKYLSGQGITL